jgi:hypothetical protein
VSTHARTAKSKAIIAVWPGILGRGAQRVLECGHWTTEPDGGRAHLAERAFCPVCAPKAARRPKPGRGATNAAKPDSETARLNSRDGEASKAVAKNHASDEMEAKP